MIAAALGEGSAHGVRIHYIRDPWHALETGGGIRQALPLLGDEPFLLVNGDVYTDVDVTALRLAPGDLAQLVLVPNPPHHPRGDFHLAEGRITAEQGERLTYSGIAMLHPGLLADAEPGRFALLPWLLKARDAGRLGGQRHDGLWIDVGTPERLADLDARLRRMGT